MVITIDGKNLAGKKKQVNTVTNEDRDKEYENGFCQNFLPLRGHLGRSSGDLPVDRIHISGSSTSVYTRGVGSPQAVVPKAVFQI